MDRPKTLSRKPKRGFFYLGFRILILLVLWALIAVTTIIIKAVEEKQMMIVSMPHTIWLKKLRMPHDTVKVTLSGPIDTRLTKRKRYFHLPAMAVRVEWRDFKLRKIFVHTSTWHVYLLKNETEYTKASRTFWVSPADLQNGNDESSAVTVTEWGLAVSVISVKSKSDWPVGLKMNFEKSPITTGMEVIYAICLIIVLYAMIITEYINRKLALILLCTAALTLMTIIGHKPTFKEIVGYVPFGTFVILLGSMIIMTLMSETGFFDYVTLVAYRISKGNSWVLILLMCMFAALMSAILDNVTVILLLAPASIRLCEAAFINTKYVLIIMAIYSNLGGSITPVGAPPNVIVASNRFVQAHGIDFSFFLSHMLPVWVICMLTVFGLIFCCVGGRIYELDNHQLARRHALKKPTPEIQERIEKLKRKMQARRWRWLKPEPDYFETLAMLEANQPVMNLKLLLQIGLAFLFTIFGFCTISIPELIPKTSIYWITMLAAFLVLILANQKSISPLLARIEWGMLIYLISLFILTEVIVELGFMSWLGERATAAMTNTNINEQTIAGMMVILWTSAVVSAFIDNSAVATILLKLCIEVGMDEGTAVPLMPLVWALLLGTNCGGNGTLLGSISNEFMALSAMQHGYKISFMEFFYVGFPIMMVTLIICSLCLLAAMAIFPLDVTWAL